jgi:MFS family permease
LWYCETRCLRPPSERAHPTRTLLILGTEALAFALAQTMLIPALPELMRGLDTDESGVTWTLTAYLVAAAVFTPLVGRLGDIFGKRRLLVISLLAFAAGSVVAAISASLWIVVVGRVIQGVGAASSRSASRSFGTSSRASASPAASGCCRRSPASAAVSD